MRSLSLAVMLLLLLRIAYGSTEEGQPNSPSTQPTPEECAQSEECLRQLCSRFSELCQKGTNCDPRISDCLDSITKSESLGKRGAISKNSFLFMKLHPILNRAVDPNLMNVPTRYRRIGVRLGSEFLGKRSGGKREEAEAEESEVTRGRRLPGNELLGKRHGSEMLGKRNVEMLGKRGVEFLGKRGTEFLGKRGTEFLGKRGAEFLGKRNRWRNCRDGEMCYVRGLPSDSRMYVRYFKVTAGAADADTPEEGYRGRSNRQMNQSPVFLVERL